MKAEWLHHLSNHLGVLTSTRLTPTLEKDEVSVQRFEKYAGANQSNSNCQILMRREWVIVVIAT